ncbi:hypothetical protein GP486_006818 [Trichoglossum hirsutum]|uniref:Protein kinase domain-containing protein n=1 Tax=Trichoglossum hirsutum TaxID=265104 RepID=A0A9P8ID14_9PEZI|nr:hypothetical protein GP486_006818 [Trichoglossum hirsutum]
MRQASSHTSSLGHQISSSDFRVLEDKLTEYFGDPERARYSDLEIQRVSSLLRYVNPKWSIVPRMYIVLRTIGQLYLLDAFTAQGITDFWFPFSARTLPDIISSSARSDFLNAQAMVLTKSVDLEKGDQGSHQHFARGEPLPLESQRSLGTGAYSHVDEVRSLVSHNVYARKRIRKDVIFERAWERMESFQMELKVLKRARHHHIVRLIGSYSDPTYVGLIMSPVADCHLGDFFSVALSSADKKVLLRSFFGCLATALAYLHDSQIRHKDIKPQNILVKGETVMLTDFGISLDWAELDQSTTQHSRTAKTPRYCAPEVDNNEARNSASDVWSLGCVFLEIVSVLKGKTVDVMKDFFERTGSGNQAFSKNQLAIDEWIVTLLIQNGPEFDNDSIDWIQKMLQRSGHLRPRARDVADHIRSMDMNAVFCGACCIETNDYSAKAALAVDAHGLVAKEEDGVAKRALPNSGSSPFNATSDTSRVINQLSALGFSGPRATSKPSATGLAGRVVAGHEALKAVEAVSAELPSTGTHFEGVEKDMKDGSGNYSRGVANLPGNAAAQPVRTYQRTDVGRKNTETKQENTSVIAIVERHDPQVPAREQQLSQPLDRTPNRQVTAGAGLADTLGSGGPPGRGVYVGTAGENTPEEGALLQALLGGHIEIVKRFLKNPNVNLNKPLLPHGVTALYIAAMYNRIDIVQEILLAGGDPNVATDDGSTPIHISANRGDLKLAEVLLDAGTWPNPRSANGPNSETTPLHMALIEKHPDVAERLLQSPDIEIDAIDGSGKTPLHLAACRGNLRVVKELLLLGADAEGGKTTELTPLRAAAQEGHLEVIKALLAAEPSPNVNSMDDSGGTVLQAAAYGGHLAVVDFLLKAGASPDTPSKDGMTPLFRALVSKHWAVAIRLLQEPGIDVNRITNRLTALTIAATSNSEALVKEVIRRGALLDPPVTPPHKPLYQAAMCGDPRVMEALLTAEPDLNLAAKCDSGGPAAIHVASQKGHDAVVSVLLKHGASPNLVSQNTGDRTPIHISIIEKHSQVTRVLLQHPQINVNVIDRYGGTPLLYAARLGDARLVKDLLGCGAMIEQANPAGLRPLRVAAQGGHVEVVRALLAAHPKPDINARGSDGATALEAAAIGGHDTVVELLLLARDDFSPPGKSPLFIIT